MNGSLSNMERAEVIAEALPYIKKYVGKTVVIKYGGAAMANEELKRQVMKDIVLAWLIGIKIVLIHGGGPEITGLMEKVGKTPEFVDGLRVTDRETVEIAQMALSGKVNKTLVNLIDAAGGRSVGISGVDARLIEAEAKDEKLGFVGKIKAVKPKIINDLLDNNYIPVISTIGCDRDGNIYNVNADTAAAYIAGALGAERLIMMTDIAGILEDRNDPSSLIPKITVGEAASLREKGIISGGMIPKVECCIDAIEAGVKVAVIMDGRVPHSILTELLTNEGAGTMVTR